MKKIEQKKSFLFLAATTPWVYELAHRLGETHHVHVVAFYDYLTFRRVNDPFPAPEVSQFMTRSVITLPPGFANTFELFFRLFLRIKLKKIIQKLSTKDGASPYVIVPYPYLVPWVSTFKDCKIIYYNLDDYKLYYSSKKQISKTMQQENELIKLSHKVVCLSDYQKQYFEDHNTNAIGKIHHFPLGVVKSAINPGVSVKRTKTVVYIGNLSNRVDWKLCFDVICHTSGVKYVFIGDKTISSSHHVNYNWVEMREKTLNLPNVMYDGFLQQKDVFQYYWESPVNWMPYDINHPFNKASCPTKIMDGIASGRTVLSSYVPECLLYNKHIHLFNSAQEAIHLIKSEVNKTRLNKNNIDFAASNTWEQRGRMFVNLLNVADENNPSY